MEMVRMQRRTPEINREVAEPPRVVDGDSLPMLPFWRRIRSGGKYLIAPFRLGLQDEQDYCWQRPGGPIFDSDRMLLQVAANQAVIALHEAQILSDQRRVTDQLERWVAERTAQLTAVNEDLKKEIIERKETQEALKTSEERFRLLIEGVKDYAIFLLDAEGRVMTWNNGAEQIKGYYTEEILGKHFSAFYQPEDVQADRPRARAEGSGGRGALRRGRLALAQRRISVLGQRGDHRTQGQERQAPRFCQSDPGHHRAQASGGEVAAQRGLPRRGAKTEPYRQLGLGRFFG